MRQKKSAAVVKVEPDIPRAHVVEVPAPVVKPVETAETIKEDQKKSFEWLQVIQDFADTLTIKKILTVFLTGVFGIGGMLIYENRDEIFNNSLDSLSNQSSSVTWEVSSETKAELTNLVRVSNLVKLTMITEVDLQKNRRIPRWFFLNDPEEAQFRIKNSTLLAQPVFDYDPKNTSQMISILNNEFQCTPYSDTIYQRLFPELSARTPYICGLAIPPFYGRFAGILTLGLSVVPTKGDIDSLRLESSRIAIEIYLRDVVKKPIPGAAK